MPDLDQAQDQDTSSEDQPYQVTGDDLAELHGVAAQLHAAGDPRAGKLWDFIAAQSGGGDGPGPTFRVTESPLQVTSWLEDLENDLWGKSGGGRGSQPSQGAEGNEDPSAYDANDPVASAQPPRNGQPLQQRQQRQAGQQPRQQNQGQPQPTATVVITYDKTAGIKYGSHAGLYLTGTPDGDVLYDPSGSYKQHTRGSSGLLTRDDDHVSLEDYVNYHKATGSAVKTYAFDLSPADVNRIYGRAEKQGEQTGPWCTTYVSSAISGIGPFATVHNTLFPGSLASELEDLQFAGTSYVPSATGSGKALGGGGSSAW